MSIAFVPTLTFVVAATLVVALHDQSDQPEPNESPYTASVVPVLPPVPPLGTVAAEGWIWIQSTLKSAAPMAMRITCVPAARLTVFVTSVQFCQPPVEGTLRPPVLSTPPNRTFTTP